MGSPRIIGSSFALALMAALPLAGCGTLGSSSLDTYDLTAPTTVKTLKPGRAQVVVALPTALQALDSERILVRSTSGQVSYVAGAQWADKLPQLVQARLIQTFENAKRIGTVGRPEDKLVPDVNLVIEIRSFEIDLSNGGNAVVTLSARMVGEQGGRIVAANIFTASVPSGGTDGAHASAALNEALRHVLADVVVWTATKI